MDGLNEAARQWIATRNVPTVLDAELGPLFTVVSEIDAQCVGVGALDGGEIRRVYVDPTAHGLGVGSSIMDHLEAEALRRGLTTVRLEASPSSVPFYESRSYIPGPEERLDIGAAEFRFIPMTRDLKTQRQ